jgi:hypothetical protein
MVEVMDSKKEIWRPGRQRRTRSMSSLKAIDDAPPIDLGVLEID